MVKALLKKLEKASKLKKGAIVFVYPVKNPNRFGVAEIKKDKIVTLKEKTEKNKIKFSCYRFVFI